MPTKQVLVLRNGEEVFEKERLTGAEICKRIRDNTAVYVHTCIPSESDIPEIPNAFKQIKSNIQRFFELVGWNTSLKYLKVVDAGRSYAGRLYSENLVIPQICRHPSLRALCIEGHTKMNNICRHIIEVNQKRFRDVTYVILVARHLEINRGTLWHRFPIDVLKAIVLKPLVDELSTKIITIDAGAMWPGCKPRGAPQKRRAITYDQEARAVKKTC